MEYIDSQDTAKLLLALDKDIEMKCMEIKEKLKEKRLKKVFYFSCIILSAIFIIGGYFDIGLMNIVLAFIAYQAIALVLLIPVLSNFNKEAVS